MHSRLQLREFLAWMTLVAALILFSMTIAFAQSKSISVNSDDGKVHIQISKTENGKTIHIDTTFEATDEMDIERIIRDLSGESGEGIQLGDKDHSRVRIHSKGSGKNNKQIIIDVPELSEADREKLHENLKESMKGMKESMEQMKESLKDIHIFIDDFDDEDFHFKFNCPDFDSDEIKSEGKHRYSYSYSFEDNDEIDSLDDADHVIIMGDADEKPPVLEKVIKSKNGNQVFIYKRSDSSNRAKKSEKPAADTEKEKINGLHDLSYYPNPTSGKFTLSFQCDQSDDIAIKVLDSNSKVVFSDLLEDFRGEYSREINLSGRSKGNYIIKVTIGEKSISKKIVLN